MGFQARVVNPIDMSYMFPRFTFGVIPGNLLVVASMVAESFSSTYLWVGIGGTWDRASIMPPFTVWDQVDAGSAYCQQFDKFQMIKNTDNVRLPTDNG